VDLADVEAVACCRRAVGVDVDVVAGYAAFGEGAAGVRYRLDDPLDPFADRLQ